MNVVVLIGRLAREPELRYTTAQKPVCSTTIAVDKGRDSNGNDRGADFIRLTIFGKQGETFQKYLTKGRQVAVRGRINTGSYVNQKGDTVYTTDVIVDAFDFIGNKADGNGSGNAATAGFQAVMPAASDWELEPDYDDDVPF